MLLVLGFAVPLRGDLTGGFIFATAVLTGTLSFSQLKWTTTTTKDVIKNLLNMKRHQNYIKKLKNQSVQLLSISHF